MQGEIRVHFVPCLRHIPNLTSVFCWTFELILCFWRCRRLESTFSGWEDFKGQKCPWLWCLVQMSAHMAGSSLCLPSLTLGMCSVHCWDAFPLEIVRVAVLQ